MRKLARSVLVAAMAYAIAPCKPALAGEWVVFESMPDATIYVDPSTIQKNGSHAEMWVLINYKTPQHDKTGKDVLSDKLHYRYDCKEKQLSIIATSAHAGPMASGEIINTNPDPPQLTPVPAGTTAEKMWERACGSAPAK